MQAMLFDTERPMTRAGIVPRDYQTAAHDKTFELFATGTLGVLERMFTGAGKTLVACLIADTWLRRGNDYRVMVVSYEVQLVSQFAEEIHDYIGIEPGIEMADRCANPTQKVVVASRQTLLRSTPPTAEQLAELAERGVTSVGACPKKVVDKYLKHLRKDGDVDSVLQDIEAVNSKPEASASWSRLHKFPWQHNWLIIFDEAHRHAHKLDSVGHIVDWFDQNPNSRRLGLTATPKRGDGVNIGDKMFPGIAVDYPLYSRSKGCAVKDGWAVPYVQRYIEVEGVDFKAIKKDSKGDFDEVAMQQALQGDMGLAEEGQLAKLVTPMLDMVGDRRTLIFSPGVEMALNVARFINARVKASCECGLTKWYPKALVGAGATCECGRFIEQERVITKDEQARQLDGSSPDTERNEVYKGHQRGKFQFLSVCSLCREGYNDPDIAAVAVFRPVSKRASSLAEQMKGRSCRVLRELAKTLHTLPDAEARVKAIAESSKPNCIAEGTLILTDCGLVSIESVTTEMKVWDGVEFVTHCGSVLSGEQETITYTGLTATTNHKVWIHDEKNSTSKEEAWTTFGDAAAKQIPIRVTGFGWQAVREADCCFRGDCSSWSQGGQALLADGMRLRGEIVQGVYQLGSIRDKGRGWLPKMWATTEVSTLVLESLCIGERSLHEQEQHGLQELWGKGYSVPICVGGSNGVVGEGESRNPQGDVFGQDQQRRPLRTGKSSPLDESTELLQHAEASSFARSSRLQDRSPTNQIRGRHVADTDSQGIVLEGNSGTVSQTVQQTKSRVWDILNAGPRHRFTANGLLVGNSLIIDLVGITGLADCASTVEIYAEGLPDEIKERAAEVLAEDGLDEEADVEGAIQQAQQEADERREQARREREAAERQAREEFERRSRADAQAKYTAHEVGYTSNVDPDAASDGQYKYMRFLGMELKCPMLKSKAGRLINQLKTGVSPEEVARTNRLAPEDWAKAVPSVKQLNFMRYIGLNASLAKRPCDASLMIDSVKDPQKCVSELLSQIGDAKTPEELMAAGKSVGLVVRTLRPADSKIVIDAGKAKRASFAAPEPVAPSVEKPFDDLLPV